MNDRFKFRVWDKEQNKYLSLVSRSNVLDFWISLDNTGVYLVERDNNRDIAYFNDITEDVIVQFCTGLKDKNGKLIYEGDIVKEYFYNTEETSTKKVMFDIDCGCYTYIDDIEYNQLSRKASEKLEVIGNIYENKELLE